MAPHYRGRKLRASRGRRGVALPPGPRRLAWPPARDKNAAWPARRLNSGRSGFTAARGHSSAVKTRRTFYAGVDLLSRPAGAPNLRRIGGCLRTGLGGSARGGLGDDSAAKRAVMLMGLITSHRDICMVRSREGGGGLEERSEEGLLDCFGASLGWMGKEVGRVNELNKREVFRMRERWLGGA